MGVECCHLHVHSRNSFKDGLSPVEDLVAKAAWLGQPGMGLTDHGVLFGAPSLFAACKKHGIKPIIGMEAYEAVPHTFDMERDGEVFKVKWADLAPGQDRYFHLTIWAITEVGWRNLCSLHTRSFTDAFHATQRGKPLIDRASLEAYSEGLIVGLGCPASRTSQMIDRDPSLDLAYTQAKWYVDVFGDRCYMEVMGNTDDQIGRLRGQRLLAKRLGVRVVATNDVHYLDRRQGVENGAHHVLVQSRAFKKADTETSGDKSDAGFGEWYGSDGFYLKTGEEMLASGGLLLPEIEESVAILHRADFDFSVVPKPKPPIAPVPEPGADPAFDAWVSGLGEDGWESVMANRLVLSEH